MEELKILVDMVAKLPAMALWVLAGFWAYKVVIVGSIYGVIRYSVDGFIKWRTFVPPVPPAQSKEFNISGMVADESVGLALIAQIQRLVETRYGRIYMSEVDTLKTAINYIENQRKPAK